MVADSISGKTYGKKNAEAAIKKLNPGPNDIVVFYYSGHGFRKAGPNPRFPLIDLRAKPTKPVIFLNPFMNLLRKASKRTICVTRVSCFKLSPMSALMREACAMLDGRGGGKPELAQGGGKNVARLEEAIVHIEASLNATRS